MTNETESENYSALLGRLQKLERKNRNMKRFGVLALVATAALILMGQTGKSRALDADSLVIRDANGRIRIEFGSGDDAAPTIKMYGGADNKTASVLLSSDQKGSGLFFFGGKGLMLLSNVDSPSLAVANGTGGTVVDVASVHTYDDDKFNGFLGRTSTVNPKTGATTQTSAATLSLVGKDGKIIWQAP